MVRVAVCACACLLALSGCGDDEQPSTQDSSTPVATSPSTTTPATTPATSAETPTSARDNAGGRCTAADLTGEVTNADAGAGNRYADLVVTNTGARTCTLFGYGGLEFVGANGRARPTNLVRSPNPGPSLVTLAPGQTAAKKLHWSVIPSGDEPQTGPCQPASTGIRVIPPDDTVAFAVPYEFGSVCSGGRIEGSAYFGN